MVEKQDDMFFVGIRDPVEIRRSMLESTKNAIEDLQRFEKFKAVRDEKAETILKLRSEIKEIEKLVGKLKTSLPKGDLRIKLHGEEIEPKKEKAKKKAVKKKTEKEILKEENPELKPKEVSELEKLEAELGEIEGRLTTIS